MGGRRDLTVDRRGFLKAAAALGLVGPVVGCSSGGSSGFAGSVLIVGAGAAGMSAGHLLRQQGIDFRIVEAGPTHGGRIRQLRDFVDFPIPLGGEWLHTSSRVLGEIVNDDDIEVAIETVGYAPDLEVAYFDGELELGRLGRETDRKFVGSSWLDFFDEFITPGIADRMTFDTPVTRIDYIGTRVTATDAVGATHTADAVIVTVPITVLRDGDIEFAPPLPENKIKVLNRAKIWGGLKVFIEFAERFYPTYLEFADSYTRDGERLYYDAAHGQVSDANVLGLFTVGAQAEPYQAHTGDDLLAYVLAELDEVFDGAATRHYLKHVAQNWSAEPFVRQAYLADNARTSTSRALAEPIDSRIFFAGDAYTKFDDWSQVHVAAQSARDAVDALLAPAKR